MLNFFKRKPPEPDSLDTPKAVEIRLTMTPDFRLKTNMIIPQGQDGWAWSAINILFKPEIVPHFLDNLEKPIDESALAYVRFTAMKFLETEAKMRAGGEPVVHPGKVI